MLVHQAGGDSRTRPSGARCCRRPLQPVVDRCRARARSSICGVRSTPSIVSTPATPATRPSGRCRSRGRRPAWRRSSPRSERLEQLHVHGVLDGALIGLDPLAVAGADVDGPVAAGVEGGEVGHGCIEAGVAGTRSSWTPSAPPRRSSRRSSSASSRPRGARAVRPGAACSSERRQWGSPAGRLRLRDRRRRASPRRLRGPRASRGRVRARGRATGRSRRAPRAQAGPRATPLPSAEGHPYGALLGLGSGSGPGARPRFVRARR